MTLLTWEMREASQHYRYCTSSSNTCVFATLSYCPQGWRKQFDFGMAVAPETEAYIIIMSACTCSAGSAIVTRAPWALMADSRIWPLPESASARAMWSEKLRHNNYPRGEPRLLALIAQGSTRLYCIYIHLHVVVFAA